MRSVNDWWENLDTKSRHKIKRNLRRVAVLGLMGIFVGGLILVANYASHRSDPERDKRAVIETSTQYNTYLGQNSSVASTQDPSLVQPTLHIVQKGDYIILIAQKLGVSWEAIIVANEQDLSRRASERCAKLSTSYRKNSKRKGHYCNEMVVVNGKSMASANSLQPGDVLKIPSMVAPQQIQTAISAVSGNRIVVVIDDTGSMIDDRARVSAWYLQAVKNSGKQVVGVIMYAEGYYRHLEAGNLIFRATGGYENTRGALEHAARYKPDSIVLVTDEPGDDWRDFRDLRLPPVIAHSLSVSADKNLKRVAQISGGTFLQSHAGQIAVSAR